MELSSAAEIINPVKKRVKWKAQVISWCDMEQHLNDLEDDNYKVIQIFDEKVPQDGQDDDYCLVISKDQTASAKRRFY